MVFIGARVAFIGAHVVFIHTSNSWLDGHVRDEKAPHSAPPSLPLPWHLCGLLKLRQWAVAPMLLLEGSCSASGSFDDPVDKENTTLNTRANLKTCFRYEKPTDHTGPGCLDLSTPKTLYGN